MLLEIRAYIIGSKVFLILGRVMAWQWVRDKNVLTLFLSGDLRKFDGEAELDGLMTDLAKFRKISVNGKKLENWDCATAALLYKLVREAKQNKIAIEYDEIPDGLEQLLELAGAVEYKPEPVKQNIKTDFLEKMGLWGISIGEKLAGVGRFLKDVGASIGRLATGEAVMRKVDFEFALEDCGYKALGIVSLVSFMVGLILAFVGALQLKMFGAQIYIASLVAIGMTRIMGAIMAGIIIAGRTGAAYAATIGTMKVNEEVDALQTMGVSAVDFLVLPRMLSLIITMPFLTMWADIMGIIGGASVAVLMLDISAQQYWHYSVQAFQLTNFWVGIFHGFIYGIIISCAGCYYGINCGRDADSVGVAATKAVVAAIVIMIVATGILTSLLEVMGI